MARRPVYNRHTGVLIPPPGPFSGPHVLYTAHGKLPGGESWSCGLRTAVLSPTMTELDRLTQNASQAWSNFFGAGTPAVRDINPAGVTFDGVTGRALTADGVTRFQVDSTTGGGLIGRSSSGNGGDQLALVVSLHTNLSGRHGRGRFYLPALAAGPDPVTGKLPTTTTLAIMNGATQLIEDIQTSHATGVFNPAIVIQSRTSGMAAAPVVSVSVGDVLDTIRGRRKKLKEIYQTSVAIPTPPVGP